jgi:hypothetical protein
MGFTTTSYPTLQVKVNAKVAKLEEARRNANEAEITKTKENAAVAEVVEELLTEPAAGPSTTGGSSLRRSQTTVPGAWN